MLSGKDHNTLASQVYAVASGDLPSSVVLEQVALLDALSRKVDGMILLGLAAAPTFMNDAARVILNAGDGLAFTLGEFLTRRPPEARKLHQFIHAALLASDRADAPPGGRVLVTRPSGKLPYVVSVTPAPLVERLLSGRSIGCVIHIQDLALVPLPTREALQAVFGLTDRESDFAIELVRCAGLESAASNAGMAINTARNHLQSIARKTGANGQTQIVQLLGRLI